MFKILDLSTGKFLFEMGSGGRPASFRTFSDAQTALNERACRATVNKEPICFLSKSTAWKRCPAYLLQIVEV
jgi:hypothetical protein